MIHSAYAHHIPGPQAQADMQKLREMFSELHVFIERLSNAAPREKAIAITKLQESSMWANRAAVLADPTSVCESS